MAFSLMNGLSEMGKGIAQYAGTAGLEMQKADMQQQALRLADQLATTREQEVTHPFQAGQQQNLLAAEAARSAANNATTLAAANISANAMPAEAKLLDYLGVPRVGSASPGTSSGASGGGASPQQSDSNQALIDSVMKIPPAGSEGAIRRAVANDVNKDPAFQDKTPGQRAAEIENRLAIAKGTMTNPESQDTLAQAIASYQKAPLDQMALMKGGGPETMAKVFKINPDYQESRYPEINKAMSAFGGGGKEGAIIRANNVGVQHLDVIDQAASALSNTDMRALNSLKNTFMSQFGSPAPTTFDGLKQIVGTEIEKAVAGGIGAASDRERLMKALDGANSPSQLKTITDGFRSLMVGQLQGLKTQYEEATGFKSGPFAFENKLAPETIKALKMHSGTTAEPGAGGGGGKENRPPLTSFYGGPAAKPDYPGMTP